MASPATYTITEGERPRSTQKGSCESGSCATKAWNRSSPVPASVSPMTAAAADSTNASANSCVATRSRLAPRAVRTAISPERVAVRA